MTQLNEEMDIKKLNWVAGVQCYKKNGNQSEFSH